MPPKASVPKNVRDRIEATEKLLEDGNKGTPTAAPAPAAPAPASPTPPEPVATPTPAVQVIEPMIKPVEPEAPKPHEPATPEELLKRTSLALSALQTRYNALEKELEKLSHASQESEALRADNASLKASISELERQVSELKVQAQAKTSEVTKPTVTEQDKQRAETLGTNPEDEAAYRQSIIDSVRAEIPKPAPAPEPKPAVASTTPAKTVEPKTAPEQDTGRSAYLGSLDALVGGEEERLAIVNNPKFGIFLEMLDSTTGRKIRDIGKEADAKRDAVTMSEIYRAFDQWDKASAATDKKPSHLMPASKGGAGDLNTNKKPIYSQAQVEAFQKRVRNGDFRTIGKSAEDAQKIAKDLQFWSDEFAAARAEGRIRG